MIFYQVLEQFADNIFLCKSFGFNTFYLGCSSSFFFDLFEKEDLYVKALHFENLVCNVLGYAEFETSNFVLENFRESLLADNIEILSSKHYFEENTAFILFLKILKECDYFLPANFVGSNVAPANLISSFEKAFDISSLKLHHTFSHFVCNFLEKTFFLPEINFQDIKTQMFFFEKFLNNLQANYAEELDASLNFILQEFFLEKNQYVWLVSKSVANVQTNFAFHAVHLSKFETFYEFRALWTQFLDDYIRTFPSSTENFKTLNLVKFIFIFF
jgi:hypothetical protein